MELTTTSTGRIPFGFLLQNGTQFFDLLLRYRLLFEKMNKHRLHRPAINSFEKRLRLGMLTFVLSKTITQAAIRFLQVSVHSLEELVPEDHLVRKIENALDFHFIYELVQDKYSAQTGRPNRSI